MNVNKVILAGNMTRDPSLKYLPSQTAVTEFGLAVNRKWRAQNGEDREEVLFVDCAAFGRTGEVINEHFRKGKPIFIEGRLKFDQWEDRQGGGKRSKISVVVDQFQFVGDRQAANDDSDQRPETQYPRTRQDIRNAPRPEQPFGDEQQFKEDDIPF